MNAPSRIFVHPVTRTLPGGHPLQKRNGHIPPAVVGPARSYVTDHEPDPIGPAAHRAHRFRVGDSTSRCSTTPRSVSVMGDELLNSYGMESALDLSKAMPGTFTASIFGINGNVNIRGVTSDTYFRGMKRLENTQLFPSPITAMSRLMSCVARLRHLFGPGKSADIRTSFPKSARAAPANISMRHTGRRG